MDIKCTREDVRVVELGIGDEAELQVFFERAADYFSAINGEPARPTEAREKLQDPLPPGWRCSRRYWLGYRDAHEQLVAVVNIAADS